MRLSARYQFKAILLRTMIVFAALLLPQVAHADCPPPKTPPTIDQFYYCFDAGAIAPQPIIGANKGPFVVVEVELNGRRLPALFDTGAEVSLVDSSVARDVGLKTVASGKVTASDGRKTDALKAPIEKLVIGGFIRTGGFVVVSDLGGLRRTADQPFAMVLGADVLSQVALFVNRDNQSVLVIPSNANVTGSGWLAPLRLRQPGNLLTTELSIDGHPVTAKLDTGSDGELRIRDQKWAEVAPSDARVTTIATAGAAGIFTERMIRFEKATMGDQPIGDVIATNAPGAIDPTDADLGMGILSRFNLFLNPTKGVMVLTKPQNPAPARRETMVGIQGPPTDDGITIMHVMAHSPAEAAGLKMGDRICAVDGETIRAAWYGDPKHEWMAGPEGKTVVLGRCGGGTVRVTLRKFY
jgi:hypothetical protein